MKVISKERAAELQNKWKVTAEELKALLDSKGVKVEEPKKAPVKKETKK